MLFHTSTTLVAAGLISCILAAPSPQSLGADLSIVQHNDLYGNSSDRTDAVIILGGSQAYLEASRACQKLSESLWTPEDPDQPDGTLTPGSINVLHALPSTPSSSNQSMYWINSSLDGGCRAVTSEGRMRNQSCNARLPALCTQSAALSSPNSLNVAPTWQTIVQSGTQQYLGFRDKLSFRFQGVRYASQPKRFTYSTPFEGMGNYSALEFGPQCVQGGCTSPACSEDCLFLNIWTPYLPASSNNASASLKPVVFWIHGGAFTGGTGSDSTFDGGNMASRGDVVFVAINYRLTTLGFLALDDGQTNGNYGLADQITALEWVHSHIRAFGGDPSRITIVGQSAGAASVRALLASPKAKDKFAAAIPMSNLAGSNYAATYSQYYTIAEEVSVAANAILSLTNCANTTSPVNCLRNYDAIKLASLSTVARYVVQDGTYITTPNLPLRANSTAPKVPVLMGFMRDDAAAFIGYPTTTNLSLALLDQGFSNPNIVSSGLYPIPQGPNTTLNIFNVTGLVSTDLQFRCLDYATAFSAVKNNVFPDVYFYEFNRSYQMRDYSPNFPTCNAPVDADHPYGDPSKEYFKCHSGELFSVFGTTLRQGYPERDQDDIPFSQFALDTWASFARTFNPNPDLEWLARRGYTNTTAMVSENGEWAKIDAKLPVLRTLQAGGMPSKGFEEDKARCDLLGFPLDWYETH